LECSLSPSSIRSARDMRSRFPWRRRRARLLDPRPTFRAEPLGRAFAINRAASAPRLTARTACLILRDSRGRPARLRSPGASGRGPASGPARQHRDAARLRFLRPSHLLVARFLRSRAPLSLATCDAFSNSEITPSNWRIMIAVGSGAKEVPIGSLFPHWRHRHNWSFRREDTSTPPAAVAPTVPTAVSPTVPAAVPAAVAPAVPPTVPTAISTPVPAAAPGSAT
jgi:hypothetical protein